MALYTSSIQITDDISFNRYILIQNEKMIGDYSMGEFEIIERVGVSTKSISDAVQNAIDKIEGDRNIHFFEIVQQRGKVDDKRNIEFQIILKIGIV